MASFKSRFEALIMACSDVVYQMNADWTTMHQLHGKQFIADTSNSTVGWLEQYIPPDERQRVLSAVNNAITSKSLFALEHRVFRIDGTVGWTRSRAIPILDEQDNVKEWFGVASDISEAKSRELAQQDRNAHLHKAGRQKDHFLAILSHELRNPLAPLSNCIAILESDEATSLEVQKTIAIMRRQMTQLSRLTDDLLDVTRIAENKVRISRERLDLSNLVREALENHRWQFERAGVYLKPVVADVPFYVFGDPSRLTQVLGNLLHNACKFTPAGGWTRVSVHRTNGNQVEMHVDDSGVGIEPELAVRLFQPFIQADDTLNRNMGGLGLGLALCRSIAELHDGAISVHSNGHGHGSRFVVRLPLDDGNHVAIKPLERVQQKCARHVLIIEDNRDAAESLREILQRDGHTVDLAFDGAQGLSLARTISPDIVVCDIGLPTLDGYAVVKAMRNDTACRGAFFIGLSGYGFPSDVQRAHEAGFDVHMTKPPSVKKLKSIINSF